MTVKIIIVGGSAAGVTTLYQIIEQVKILKSENVLPEVEVLVLEKTGQIGPGLAYSTTDDAHILNLPAEVMSAVPDQPDHFINWANSNKDKWTSEFPKLKEIQPGTFPPRRLFGMYLSDLAITAQKEGLKHDIPVKFLDEEVVDIERNLTGFKLTCKSKREFAAYQVVLCLGHLPADQYQELIGTPGYYHFPYGLTWLPSQTTDKPVTDVSSKQSSTRDVLFSLLSDAVPSLDVSTLTPKQNTSLAPVSIISEYLSDAIQPSNKSVIVQGIGPTAIDTILSLLSHGHTGKIYSVSPSGQLQTVLGKSDPEYKREYLTEEKINDLTNYGMRNIKLTEIILLLLKELKHAFKLFQKEKVGQQEAKGEFSRELLDDYLSKPKTPENWLKEEIAAAESKDIRPRQTVFFSLYYRIQYIWSRLGEEAQLEFQKKYNSIWMKYLVAMPLQSARKIYSAIESGQLVILSGVIADSLKYDQENHTFEVRTKTEVVKADMVLNCIGNGHRIDTSLAPPLLKELVARKLVLPHPAGGLRVKFETSQAIGKVGETVGMFIVGDLCYGSLLATADCKQTVLQASRCVASIKDALKARYTKEIQRSETPDVLVLAAEIANQGSILDYQAYLFSKSHHPVEQPSLMVSSNNVINVVDSKSKEKVLAKFVI